MSIQHASQHRPRQITIPLPHRDILALAGVKGVEYDPGNELIIFDSVDGRGDGSSAQDVVLHFAAG